ncbi:YafY family protein [soil metagenome]
MNRTDRLYAIVEELRAAGADGRTAERLAERFEVSTRTVKRDVSALQQAGVPVWATAGPGGGYALDASATMPPLTFTVAEATAVAVALASGADQPFAPDGRTALAKLLGAMSPEGRAAVTELGSRLWLRPGDADGRPDAARPLDEALRRQVVVKLDYVDGEDRQTVGRPVEPLALARTGGHWTLLGWCRLRDGGRWFRLDRITAVHLPTTGFEERDLLEVFGTPPPDVRTVLSSGALSEPIVESAPPQ